MNKMPTQTSACRSDKIFRLNARFLSSRGLPFATGWKEALIWLWRIIFVRH